MLPGVMRISGLLCKVHYLRIADLNAVYSIKAKIILAMNDRLFFSDMSVSQLQRMAGIRPTCRCCASKESD